MIKGEAERKERRGGGKAKIYGKENKEIWKRKGKGGGASLKSVTPLARHWRTLPTSKRVRRTGMGPTSGKSKASGDAMQGLQTKVRSNAKTGSSEKDKKTGGKENIVQICKVFKPNGRKTKGTGEIKEENDSRR